MNSAPGDVVGFNPGLPTGGDVTARELRRSARAAAEQSAACAETSPRTALSAFLRLRSRRCRRGVDVSLWRRLGSDRRSYVPRSIPAPSARRMSAIFMAACAAASIRRPILAPTVNQARSKPQAVRDACEATGVPSAAVFTAGVQSNNIIEGYFGGNPRRRRRDLRHLHGGRGVSAELPARLRHEHRLFRYHARRRDCAARRRV